MNCINYDLDENPDQEELEDNDEHNVELEADCLDSYFFIKEQGDE